MRRFFMAALAALLGVALAIPRSAAAAGDSEHADLQRRIAQLEGLVDELQQKVVPAAYAQPSGDDAAMQPTPQPTYTYRTYSNSGPSGSVYVNIEYGFVKPYATNGDAPNSNTVFGLAGTAGIPGSGAGNLGSSTMAAPAGPVPATVYDYKFAPRFTWGVTLPSGMGLRTRYFLFDQNARNATDGSGNDISGRLRAQTLDIETYGTLRRGRNWGTMYGGYRYADFTTASTFTQAGIASRDTARQGAFGSGITAGLMGTSIIGETGNFSINSGLRGSLMLGDLTASAQNALTGAIPIQFTNQNNFFSIWELVIGSQYRRRLNNGTNLILGSSIEAQLWQNAGSLNPWSFLGANGGGPGTGIVATPGSFVMFGFWNNLGWSF